eukprot:CAMPEP_0170525680 /NCGR_PEP_ID=MMETSP0209-20121228/11139_1 /TAXON_ID=665100 ORGANISM="Litonotus pictus, Strain P1" /NCGR_SAMPLE_ID=MMETSP0209 /ASSEMBLY_ACC=CAM_ASM_000301 /LENGTH=52 /DNA_ID=CAMNT_0010815061 /DNA_START=26 /DNA_END=180 /DNA_ORIENTATION=-
MNPESNNEERVENESKEKINKREEYDGNQVRSIVKTHQEKTLRDNYLKPTRT